MNLAQMSNLFSLTPGFSPVPVAADDKNRFNGFLHPDKPLKRLARCIVSVTEAEC